MKAAELASLAACVALAGCASGPELEQFNDHMAHPDAPLLVLQVCLPARSAAQLPAVPLGMLLAHAGGVKEYSYSVAQSGRTAAGQPLYYRNMVVRPQFVRALHVMVGGAVYWFVAPQGGPTGVYGDWWTPLTSDPVDAPPAQSSRALMSRGQLPAQRGVDGNSPRLRFMLLSLKDEQRRRQLREAPAPACD
jgi:hypothetical protein